MLFDKKEERVFLAEALYGLGIVGIVIAYQYYFYNNESWYLGNSIILGLSTLIFITGAWTKAKFLQEKDNE